jgi:hypothetical protein
LNARVFPIDLTTTTAPIRQHVKLASPAVSQRGRPELSEPGHRPSADTSAQSCGIIQLQTDRLQPFNDLQSIRVVEMKNHRNRKRVKKPRVGLTDRDIKYLSDIYGTDSATAMAKRTGLPYMLVYNIVHGRVKSISNRNYRTLFDRPPPPRAPLKVDGASFRAMVDMWLFLNEGATKADLYRDLFGSRHSRRIDHRIFNGKIVHIEARLEYIMRKKFSDAGVDGQLLDQWLDEFEAITRDDRVPYDHIRPVLLYLEERLGVHPTSILNQSVIRYETGMLKRVSRRIFDRAMALKQKTETALADERPQDMDKIRESLVGGKSGYTLYSDIKEELSFLRRHARKSAKYYLGRGPWTYETGKAKRIRSWRARQILEDCDRFIRETPALPLASLPPSRQQAGARIMIDILLARTAQLLSEQDGIDFEKRILRPTHRREEYNNQYHGFTPFDMASSALGMKRKAFDLMVAKNCEIFRSVGKFTQRWYLSDLYLKELAKRENFDLISTKYELMAKKLHRSRQINACMS